MFLIRIRLDFLDFFIDFIFRLIITYPELEG